MLFYNWIDYWFLFDDINFPIETLWTVTTFGVSYSISVVSIFDRKPEPKGNLEKWNKNNDCSLDSEEQPKLFLVSVTKTLSAELEEYFPSNISFIYFE